MLIIGPTYGKIAVAIQARPIRFSKTLLTGNL
jgi:hypothetical protein